MNDASLRRMIDEARLDLIERRRGEMIDDLISNRQFNPNGAVLAVDNFLETLRYVLNTTGQLPETNLPCRPAVRAL